jgi:hypothetical protein
MWFKKEKKFVWVTKPMDVEVKECEVSVHGASTLLSGLQTLSVRMWSNEFNGVPCSPGSKEEVEGRINRPWSPRNIEGFLVISNRGKDIWIAFKDIKCITSEWTGNKKTITVDTCVQEEVVW